MKRTIMGTLSFALLTLLVPLPSSAQTYAETCDASSFVILPGGQCIDLSYLEILGESRATRQQIERAYQRQFNANVELEMLYNQYPEYVSETEEERNARYQNLAETSLLRDEAVEGNEEVETILFPIHTRTMAIMRDAFVHHLYDR